MNPNQGPNQEPNGPEYQGYQGYQGYPPPPPSPGYPQSGQGYPGPTGQGFNFQDLTQRWRTVLTGRSVQTFDAQLPSANWQTIWISLVIYGVVRGVIGAIETAITPTVRIGNTVTSTGSPVGSFIGGVIGAFIGFFIGVGILYLIAKAFNGAGTFLSYGYLLTLFFVPLGIASAVLGLIPVLGILAGLAIAIFEIYLAILATASAHRLPMDRATWVVLIPVIVGFVLALIAALLFAAALATFM